SPTEAMAAGLGPTPGMVFMKSPECELSTDTSPEAKLATNTRLPSAEITHPNGSVPTGTVWSTCAVCASMTETVPLRRLETKTLLSSGEIATDEGSSPTGTSASFVLASPPTAITETELLSGLTTQTNWSSLVMAMGPEAVACAAARFALKPKPKTRPMVNTVRTLREMRLLGGVFITDDGFSVLPADG